MGAQSHLQLSVLQLSPACDFSLLGIFFIPWLCLSFCSSCSVVFGLFVCRLWLIVASIFLEALKMFSRVIHGEYEHHERSVAQHSSTRLLPSLPRKQLEAVDESEESLLSSWLQKVTCGG